MKPLYTQFKEKQQILNNIEKDLNKNTASYKLSKETGWRRIAVLNKSVVNSQFYISHTGYPLAGLTLNVICLNGWEQRLAQYIYRYTNSINIFSKARLLFKGNSGGYLELYKNNTTDNSNIKIYITNSQAIELLQEETIIENIPTGFQQQSIDLKYS